MDYGQRKKEIKVLSLSYKLSRRNIHGKVKYPLREYTPDNEVVLDKEYININYAE